MAVLAGCSGTASPGAALRQAEQLIDEGKPVEAQIRLKALVSRHPETAEAHLLLAQLSLDGGDVSAADRELKQLPDSELAKPKAQALRLWVDIGLGQHAEVLKALKGGAGNGIEPSERARIEAAALRARGTPADALEVLRAAGRELPSDPDIAVELASTLAAIGNLEQARYELDRFLEKSPNEPDVLAARGALSLRSGATAKAVDDLRAALKSAPASWHPYRRINTRVLLGDAALATGNLALAKEQMAAIDEESPGVLGGRLLAAGIALFEGRAGDAADQLEVVAQTVPDNPRVQYMLAEAWSRGGNTARAMNLLERRVREAPDDASARRMLARLVRRTRPDQVVELLSDLPQDQMAPGSETDSLLAAARVAQEQAGEALELIEKKIAQRPDDRDLKLELAYAYLRNGQPTRALTVLNRLDAMLVSPPAAALQMRAHIAAGNDREANRMVGTLISSQKASVETLIAVADPALAMGRQDAAQRLIDEALQREPQNAGALLRRANLQFVDHEYEAATHTLQQLIDLAPSDLRARTALARVAEAKGDLQTAQKELQAAVELSPDSIEPALLLAGLHLRNGRAEDASRVFDGMIGSAARDGVGANAAGLMLLAQGRAAEARARFGQAVEQAPDQALYWFNLGRAQVLAADREAAAQSYERAVKLRPEWAEANTAAIQLNLESRQLARAREQARAFADRLPKEPNAWLMVGQVALMESRPADAVSAFARSYALRPSAIAAVREHQARVAGGTLRPAQPLLNWLTQEPTDVNVRRMLAQYYQGTGATEPLVAQLEKILELRPNDATALNNLAWAVVSNDPARAESLARRAHAIAPQQPALADTLGRALIANGKYADAVRVLADAVEGMPKDPSVRTRYALALARSGDRSAARRELQLALKEGGAFDERETADKLLRELGS